MSVEHRSSLLDRLTDQINRLQVIAYRHSVQASSGTSPAPGANAGHDRSSLLLTYARSAGRKQEEKARADVWVRAAPETWTEGGREKSDGRTREVLSQDVVWFYRRDFDFLGEPRESISFQEAEVNASSHKGNSPSIQNSVLSVTRHGLHEAAPAGFGAHNRSGQLGPCRCPGYDGIICTRRASGPCYC